MKYSMASLDTAIYGLLPTIAEAHRGGMKFNRPELLKQVAWQAFINDEKPISFQHSMYYYVVRKAALDLEEHGLFQFGQRDINKEV